MVSSQLTLVLLFWMYVGIKVVFIADARPSSSTMLNYIRDLSILASANGLHGDDEILGPTSSWLSCLTTLNFCWVRERSYRLIKVLVERMYVLKLLMRVFTGELGFKVVSWICDWCRAWRRPTMKTQFGQEWSLLFESL